MFENMCSSQVHTFMFFSSVCNSMLFFILIHFFHLNFAKQAQTRKVPVLGHGVARSRSMAIRHGCQRFATQRRSMAIRHACQRFATHVRDHTSHSTVATKRIYQKDCDESETHPRTCGREHHSPDYDSLSQVQCPRKHFASNKGCVRRTFIGP